MAKTMKFTGVRAHWIFSNIIKSDKGIPTGRQYICNSCSHSICASKKKPDGCIDEAKRAMQGKRHDFSGASINLLVT